MKPESKIKLDRAELFYRFSLGVRATIVYAVNDKALKHYGVFSYYKHSMDSKELKLTMEEEKLGAYLLERVGTYMMILQLNKVLEDEWGKGRLESKNKEIQNISRVVELIRNAFAHDPFNPIWKFTEATMNKEYEIPGILTLKTHNLHGKNLIRKREPEVKIDRKEDSKEIANKIPKVFEYANDYGGQIALFRLLQHVREKLSH